MEPEPWDEQDGTPEEDEFGVPRCIYCAFPLDEAERLAGHSICDTCAEKLEM